MKQQLTQYLNALVTILFWLSLSLGYAQTHFSYELPKQDLKNALSNHLDFSTRNFLKDSTVFKGVFQWGRFDSSVHQQTASSYKSMNHVVMGAVPYINSHYQSPEYPNNRPIPFILSNSKVRFRHYPYWKKDQNPGLMVYQGLFKAYTFDGKYLTISNLNFDSYSLESNKIPYLIHLPEVSAITAVQELSRGRFGVIADRFSYHRKISLIDLFFAKPKAQIRQSYSVYTLNDSRGKTFRKVKDQIFSDLWNGERILKTLESDKHFKNNTFLTNKRVVSWNRGEIITNWQPLLSVDDYEILSGVFIGKNQWALIVSDSDGVGVVFTDSIRLRIPIQREKLKKIQSYCITRNLSDPMQLSVYFRANNHLVFHRKKIREDILFEVDLTSNSIKKSYYFKSLYYSFGKCAYSFYSRFLRN